MRPGIKRIHMAWRAGRNHRRIIVGVIKANASSICLSYIKEGVEEARKYGFVCFPDFPDTDKVYKTNVMRVLSQRLNNSDRTDIGEYYAFWNIKERNRNDSLGMLALTGGKLCLYCLRMSDSILIAGNGGVKDTKRYQDSEELSGYVISLQNLENAIRLAVKKGEVTIEEHTIGNIDDKTFDI